MSTNLAALLKRLLPEVSQWLICENPAIVANHQAKVYGQAVDAAPTMAVPHLDTHILDGK